ncbi:MULTISPECIES: hypothetical protein [unclassified Microcoleus]|uniref:hypothetical protein n=1 Tax=unclassified Microcoleus TaxID=2642155 RepID=UPI002FCE84F5
MGSIESVREHLCFTFLARSPPIANETLPKTVSMYNSLINKSYNARSIKSNYPETTSVPQKRIDLRRHIQIDLATVIDWFDAVLLHCDSFDTAQEAIHKKL